LFTKKQTCNYAVPCHSQQALNEKHLIMAFKVTLLPGKQQFEAEAHESILNAALRAGLALDYGCRNGNCGHCQARRLEGETVRLYPHDRVFSKQEKQAGEFLLCSYAASSDLVIEAAAAHSTADIPLQQLTARLRRVERVGENTLILALRTPRSKNLRFIAGQHARLTLPNGLQRELPIASCPCDSMNLEFHIYRDAADSFTDYVFTDLPASLQIDIEGPVGDFTLDEASTAPILFIAWEAGFGPIRSLIEHSLNLELRQPVQLYWIVHDVQGHYADGYCRAISDAMDNYQYTPLCVADIHSALTQIADEHSDLSGYKVYIAMPPAVADHAIALFSAQGLQADQVKVDPLVA
jgi:CDP-4-dehydro-6-deoxyglucose reductase